MKYIEEINVENKKVLLRLDLNVTIQEGKIIDDTKIKKSIKTIQYLIDKNAKILMMSHLGKIKSEEDKKKNSLSLVAKRLEEIIHIPVFFVEETRGEQLEHALDNHNLVLMENTRFEDYPEKLESSNDEELAEYWSTLGEVFINDAFGTSHRRHASNYGISTHITSAYGFLIQEEIENLKPIIHSIQKPYTVIMGGAKVDDKIQLIESLLEECDYLLVGGGIANTFLKAQGYSVGSSLYSESYVEKVQELIKKYPDKIQIPIDAVVEGESVRTCHVEEIKEQEAIYDIGSNTIQKYQECLRKAKTVFVNGTMGLYEKSFRQGTEKLYEVLDELENTTVIAGGGDAVASVNKLGFTSTFDFLSTGGGATLDYIANKKINCFEER